MAVGRQVEGETRVYELNPAQAPPHQPDGRRPGVVETPPYRPTKMQARRLRPSSAYAQTESPENASRVPSGAR